MKKPDYCVFCREAIERDVWRLCTSYRCCENCEHLEDGGRFWKPIAAGAILFLSGVFGGQIVLQKPAPPVVIAKQQAVAAPSPQKSINQIPTNISAQTLSSANGGNQALSNANLKPAPPIQLSSVAPAKNSAPPFAAMEDSGGEAVFYCGARTQKGAPCSRRVKGGGRCWQHAGKTAILPAEKLRIQ